MPDDDACLSVLIDAHAAETGRYTDLDLTTWAELARELEAENGRMRAGLHRIHDLGPGMTREWCVREADEALYGSAPPKTPGAYRRRAEAVIFYHRTTAEAAASILTEGFRDTTGTYGTGQQFTGVWVSDRPLDENEGTATGPLLEVDIEEDTVAEYEWVQDIGYREWLVPAAILNARARARVRLLSNDEEDQARRKDRRRLGA